MKRLILFVLLMASTAAHAQDVDDEEWSVSAVLEKIQDTIVKAESLDVKDVLPDVTSVQANLTVGSRRDKEGNIRFFVFKAGSDTSKEVIQTISLRFTPEDSRASLNDVLDPSDVLAEEIHRLATAASSIGLGTLKFSGLSAYFRFQISAGHGAGLTFEVLPSVGISAGGSTTRLRAQEIFIQFGD